jgi:hypothetical protein
MPTISDQFAAAFSALIPFTLAVLAVTAMIWRAFQWRYDGVIEKLNAMLRLAAEENRIQKERQTDLATDLAAAEKKLDEFVKVKGAEGAPDLKPLKQDLSKLRLAVESASQANTAVDEALRRGATVTGAGSLTFSQPSAAIRARMARRK